VRVIARLDIKEKSVIKPIQFEGLRKVGSPEALAKKYYQNGADELIIINIVSSLYSTDWIEKFVKKITKEVFIPITIGGGIKTLNQAKTLFRHGIDKIAVCSALFEDKNLLKNLANEFGSQSVVASIQAMKIEDDWYAFKEMARKNTKIKVGDWIKECIDNGAGEILLTSIKHDGLMRGFDEEMYNKYCNICKIPLIIGGGFNGKENLKDIKRPFDAISAASIFHYNKITPSDLKKSINK
tara:strand:- start:140 stop:859 length:720 start_codon:yes stop_codon:yes gene_type:complete